MWGDGPREPAPAITRSDVCVTALKQTHLAKATLRFDWDEARMPVVQQKRLNHEI
jgi:hypothetical protein